MSLFDLRPPVEEKVVIHHPWEKTIKDQYSNKIKHAHNSINNPVYPEKSLQKKEKQPAKDRVRLTIIGNRVTKEFIYCIKVARGLHKWRWSHFDAPIIKGVTSVEWPLIWNDLKIRYGGLSYCLKSQVAVLIDDKILGGEKELQEFIESKYIYHLNLDYYKEGVAQFASYVKGSGRPFAYMHFSIDGQYIGTMIFMLYADIVPYTCANFLRLCQEKKGGYGGTPVHRIVKDGWIQCGGFGLHSTDLDCENFIVPHDRRGVLCMANAERHVDCSTQFFILLQPAPWMAQKYVAFGQLIDGESTLKKIEEVPTWYESPTSEIIIHQAGILNLDCHDFIINKGTKEYIHSHVENLFELGEIFYEELMEKVFLEAEFRRIQRLTATQVQEEQVEGEEGIRTTKRFIRRKEDIEKHIHTTESDKGHPTSVVSGEQGNREFDVEEYEPEEYSYQHVSIPPSGSVVVKPDKPYYLPLTDVPYPGEVNSTYDLKKLLRGDYCLESDLHNAKEYLKIPREAIPYISEFLNIDDISESESEDIDSDDDKEIKKYVKQTVEHMSFAGDLIKGIARKAEKYNLFESVLNFRPDSARMTDEALRRFRIASSIYGTATCKDRKVHIDVPSGDDINIKKIKRVQTGFVRPQDIRMYEKSESEIDLEDPDFRKVRIAPSAMAAPPPPRPSRRPTGFVRASELPPSSETEVRQSVLTRLYDEVTCEPDVGPTLKDYKPISEKHKRNNLLLTTSPTSRMIDDDSKDRFYRYSMNVEESFENVLNMQHGKKIARKISSDYVNTIDQIEHHAENSIRSVEFAKMRPALSVSEYQLKNQKYQEELRRSKTAKSSVSQKGDIIGKVR